MSEARKTKAELINEIAQLKKSVANLEAQLALQSQLGIKQKCLEAFWRISLASNKQFSIFTQAIIDELKSLTDSPYALVGEVIEEDALFKVIGWSKDVVFDCMLKEKQLDFDINSGGIWTQAIKSKKAVIINNYLASKKRKGLPPGHIAITRLLSVPVVRDGRVEIMVMVANKSADYNDNDKHCLELIADAAEILLRRYAVEAELLASRKDYKDLVDEVPVGIYRTSVDGEILFANKALAALLEFDSVEDLLESNANRIHVNPKDRMNQIEQWRKRKSIDYSELILRTNKGNVIYVRDTTRGIESQNGELLYFDGILEDITERKQFYDALLENEANLRALLDNSPFPVWTIKKDFHLEYFNYNYEVMLELIFQGEPRAGSDFKTRHDYLTKLWKKRFQRVFKGESLIFTDGFKIELNTSVLKTYYIPVITVEKNIRGAAIFSHFI
jgi:PAS domain S-box-containing protein